jgi:hypothetical protein
MIVNVAVLEPGGNFEALYWTVLLMRELDIDDGVEVAPFRDRDLEAMGVWVKCEPGDNDEVKRLIREVSGRLEKKKIRHTVREFMND